MDTHLNHLEDLVWTEGSIGVKKIVNYIEDLRQGKGEISIKWDGSPSIVCGYFNNEFYVTTKHMYARKIPKLILSLADLEDISDDGFAKKILKCFIELKYVIPMANNSSHTADLLFVDYELKNTSHTCQPNIIEYNFGKDLTQYNIGLAWHDPNFKPYSVPRVFQVSSKIDYCKNAIPFYLGLDLHVNEKWLDTFLGFHPKIGAVMIQAYNTSLRYNLSLEDAIVYDMNKTVSKFKQITTKLLHKNPYDIILKLEKSDKKQLQHILDFQDRVRSVKRDLINIFESRSNVNKNIIIDGERVKTTHEGYVLNGEFEMVKIVDRDKFSKYNFSPIVQRGWERQKE